MGLGPRTAQPGDAIVILFSLGYPAILRRHIKDESFCFAGLACVYGILAGRTLIIVGGCVARLVLIDKQVGRGNAVSLRTRR